MVLMPTAIKVYIAAPYPIRSKAQDLMRRLEGDGFEVTSSWLRSEDQMTDEFARVDLADVERADVLLAYNPIGWSASGTGGRHVEFGYALATGAAVVLYGQQSNIFHHLNTVVPVKDGDISGALRIAVEVQRNDRRAMALRRVRDEFTRAEAKWPPMHSPHEGHSVIREELDELWDHVKSDTGRSDEAGTEAIQVAAMGLRYFSNLTGGGR